MNRKPRPKKAVSKFTGPLESGGLVPMGSSNRPQQAKVKRKFSPGKGKR